MVDPRMPNMDFRMPSIPEIKSVAEIAQQTLVARIRRFEASLNPDEEMGVHISGALAFRITQIGFAAGMVVFYGADEDGRRVETYQHVSQVNLTLMTLKKPQDLAEARRVGFDTGFPAA